MTGFMGIATAAATANVAAATQHASADVSSIWWWIFGGVLIVLIVLYKIGKRTDRTQAQVFFERMNEDLARLLRSSFQGSEQELNKQLSELWKHNPLVNLGKYIRRIELVLTKCSDNAVECQLKAITKNDANEEFEGSATRTYDWDYLPTDVSNILIRSGKKSETLILYPHQG